MNRKYTRVILGGKNSFVKECFEGGYIGVDFGIEESLEPYFRDRELSEFNKVIIVKIQNNRPEKSKGSAALNGGSLYTVGKKLSEGDLVLCPDGEGSYLVGEVCGPYEYVAGSNLPHRRKVNWYSEKINREDMSQALKNSTGSIGTTCDVTKYSEEIDVLVKGFRSQKIIGLDDSIEDPYVFALEDQLEKFLIKNWSSIELSKTYDIYQDEDGNLIGEQYETDTGGRIDILLQSKDNQVLTVLELKRGRASDVVVGQIQRYMGYIKEVVAESHQEVKGIIIALEDDIKLRRALSVASNIEFYRYHVSFSLSKVL